jgi:hypothetical protein
LRRIPKLVMDDGPAYGTDALHTTAIICSCPGTGVTQGVGKTEMSTHAKAEILLEWLRERNDATVGEIAGAGLMNSRTASDAVQYAVRHGALQRIVRRGVSAKERVRYRVTGVALPVPRTGVQPCFDGLLSAWGITLEPQPLASTGFCRHQIMDDRPDSASPDLSTAS